MTRRLFTLIAAITTVGIGTAQADTVCRASSLRGTWLLSMVAPGGSPTNLCELSVNRRGFFSGQCIVTDRNGQGGTETFTPSVSGRMVMRAGCSITGRLVMEGEAASLEGTVWAPVDAVPVAGSVLMQQAGYPAVTGQLMRRHDANASLFD